MNSLLKKSLNLNRKIKINFDGGDLTSDSGLLLYKEFYEKIVFSKTVKDKLNVKTVLNSEFIQIKILLFQNISSYCRI